MVQPCVEGVAVLDIECASDVDEELLHNRIFLIFVLILQSYLLRKGCAIVSGHGSADELCRYSIL
jgi:hypothetical protein